MLYAWHISKIPYQTFSARYNNHFNDYDLATLQQFSAQHGIFINYVDFDVITFLETEHDYYAHKYMCGSPQITTFMKLADYNTEGTVIMSGNFITNNVGIPCVNNISLYHYGKEKNIVPWFFLETEELAHGFKFTNDELPDWVKYKNMGGYNTKVWLYQKYEFPVIPQETKLNGFEKLKEYYDTNPPRLPTIAEKMTRKTTQYSNRNFDLLYRNKYELKFSNNKYIMLC
jgi:hypothetical protein